MNGLMRFLALAFLIVTVFGFAGCGTKATSPSPSPDPSPPADKNQITVAFSVAPTSLTNGQYTTLTWKTTNATSVSITPNINDDDDGADLPTSGSRTVVPTQTTMYTLTATAPNAVTKTQSVNVTVTMGKPTISLSASPETVLAGQSSTLQWNATDSTSVEINEGIGRFTSASGTAQVSPVATTIYTATAKGAGGTATANATVSVTASSQLAISLTAMPATISAGGTSMLTWNSQNAVSVQIAPPIRGGQHARHAASVADRFNHVRRNGYRRGGCDEDGYRDCHLAGRRCHWPGKYQAHHFLRS